MLGYLLSPTVQFEDINGKPLVGGKVYVYKANTSTLATTYSDYNGTINTNPVILDLLGHCTVIADDGEYYDIEVYNNDNILLFSAHLVTVGGEGGSASVSGFDVKAGYGIKVGKSISGNKEIFTISADPTYLATKTDLNSKQNTLIPGNNISISGDTISVTGLKTINVTSPLQKTETPSGINLSIDTSGIQTTLSAGTNIDEVKLSNNIVDLKADNCSASINSIAIGQETLASGNCSFAEGRNTSAVGNYSHSEGNKTNAADFYSHSEGDETSAIGQYAHSEGYRTVASGYYSHSEGDRTSAVGDESHSEGDRTQAIGMYSHAEGTRTSALRYGDHAEGSNTVASGEYSHAEGYGSMSIGYQSHAEGYNTSAFGAQSHSEGDRTQSIGYQSHAEGYKTSAIGPASHAEGEQTSAVGSYSHAEGDRSRAIGQYSHAEGSLTSAIGDRSHAEGYYTIASGDYQTVIGKYNAPNITDLFQIGCGSADNARRNALEVKDDNTIWYNYNGSMTQLIPNMNNYIHSEESTVSGNEYSEIINNSEFSLGVQASSPNHYGLFITPHYGVSRPVYAVVDNDFVSTKTVTASDFLEVFSNNMPTTVELFGWHIGNERPRWKYTIFPKLRYNAGNATAVDFSIYRDQEWKLGV